MRRTIPTEEREAGPSCASREELARLVRDEPGLSLRDGAEALDLHVSTVSYHARRLEDKGRVRLLREGRCVRLFPYGDGMSAQEMALIAALKSDRARDVLEFLADSPGASKTEAARDLGLSVKGLGWHVDRLEELGVVRVEGDSRGYSLHLADGVERLIDRRQP